LTGDAGCDFDVLHQHSVWSYCSRATAAWRERWQRPVMITPHGALEPWTLRTSAWKKRAAWYGYERGNLAAAGCLQALCPREAQSLRELGLSNPIAHIPNGVAVEEFAQPGDGPEFRRRHNLPADARLMLFFSRVTPKKGLPMLLEALSQRRQAWRDWMLVIAGPDERGHAGELLALAQSLGLGSRVRWIGPIFGAEVRDAFAASELMTLPTHSEGSPMVVLEALAAQTPVLTTRGAPAEFLEEYGCGWQTAIDADALGTALEQACRLAPHDLQVMGVRGRNLACERFAWGSVARQTVAAYRWLLGEGPRPDFVELPRSETIVLPTRPALRRAS
jgi:glycosyltransferase involved in cell wall biosynthesis